MEEQRENENKKSSSNLEMECLFPDNYEVEAFLGEGSFGQVMRCFKKDTKETVAVKVPQHGDDVSVELNILRYLQRNHQDKNNIVRFIEAFRMTDDRVALVFENLDITLDDYIFEHSDFNGLYLHDVRSVIQQMATALSVLKSKGVIHTDIKANNIMLVDREAQPIRAKLIDFGLAIPSVKARAGVTYQIGEYRAPEIYLGLSVTEAIDMWSLGTLMVLMVLGTDLITGRTRYDRMQRLVELFGVPPDRMLNKGLYSKTYFAQTFSGQWRFKTPREYWGFNRTKVENVSFKLQSLDQLETLSLVNLNMVEADERRECIDLMKAMLRIDPDERITPYEVLNHPFIMRGAVQHSSDNEQPGTSKTGGPGTSQPEEPGHGETEEPGTIEPEEPVEPMGPAETAEPAELAGPAGPAEPTDPGKPGANETTKWQTCHTDEPEEHNNDVCSTYGTHGPVLPGVMLASSPELNCSPRLEENTEQQFYTCTNGCSGFRESSAALAAAASPRVILVQSAPPERCWDLCEDDEAPSEYCTNGCSGFHESSAALAAAASPRVILVQSAPPECCLDLCEDDEAPSESCTNGCSGFHESSAAAAAASPCVILVQSAPPECCWDLCEDDEPQREYCSTTNPSDPSEESPAEYPRVDKSRRPCSLFSAKTCDWALTATTSDHSDLEKKKKKKKKNCFKRFCSWMKKTFFSCTAGNQEED